LKKWRFKWTISIDGEPCESRLKHDLGLRDDLFVTTLGNFIFHI
jgi:hypothetical protein